MGLTEAQVTRALDLIACNKDWRAANPAFGDFTTVEVRRMFDCDAVPRHLPLFSPYAPTKEAGYSQTRFEGTKYSVHRLAYSWLEYGFDKELDVSHLVYLGGPTTRNYNPYHLGAEPNAFNQRHKACFAYYEDKIEGFVNGELGSASTSTRAFEGWLIQQNVACRHVWAPTACRPMIDYWEPMPCDDKVLRFLSVNAGLASNM